MHAVSRLTRVFSQSDPIQIIHLHDSVGLSNGNQSQHHQEAKAEEKFEPGEGFNAGEAHEHRFVSVDQQSGEKRLLRLAD